jgi:hypothetical protein
MRLRWTSIFLVAILALSSCDNFDLAQPIDPPVLTTDELVIADCYALRDALEAFAAENDNFYPDGWHGNDLVPFLPGGVRLTNRYTGLANGPVLYDPQWPGEIGVVLYSEGYDPPTGFRIVGRGRYGELERLENVARISQATVEAYDSILANADETITAADEFREAAGQYPASVGGDALPTGETIVDFLPGGRLLANPLSGYQDSPVDGAAAAPGQIGYGPNDHNGDGSWDSFIIDALGADGATQIALRTNDSDEHETIGTAARILKDAVEDFAAANAGEYPRDIDTDETPSGDTLLELVSCTWCKNPYTGASPYRNGLATSRGEVGYVPLEYNGVVVGYVVNGWGLFDELIRFEKLPTP